MDGRLTLSSDYFGTLECEGSSLFHFPCGIPGFERERHFAPIEVVAQRPLVYLQSINRPDLCLITLPVKTVCPKFELDVQPEDIALLGFPPTAALHIGEDVLCLAIVSVDEARDPVANLMAPLVVNLRTNVAVQAIQADSTWKYDYPITGANQC